MRDDRTHPATDSTRLDEGPDGGWTVVVLYSPASEIVGRALPVAEGLRFGRRASPDVDVAIDDRKLSRRHATLARRGRVLEIVDEGSSNGTAVNGTRLAAGLPRAVVAGDIVRMGDTLLEVVAQPPGTAPDDPSLIGRSAAFLEAIALAGRAAPSELAVLLLGETGTGKDVVARYVHAKSGRTGSYVAVNCAALPDELVDAALFGHKKGAFTGATADSAGLFAQAEGGTLFLDEIGELPPHQQAKLLRVLENREYVPLGSARVVQADVRTVAATNMDLTAGSFRADLHARLAGAVIRLPPLRARRGDILELAARFLGAAHRFSPHAAEALLLHPWPHNIRELRTAMQRVALAQPAGGEVSRQTIEAVLEPVPPSRPAAASAPTVALRPPTPEREELVTRLTAHRGNVHRLAEEYGKDPKQIYRWLKKLGIEPADFR